MIMKFVKNTGKEKRTLNLPDGSMVVLSPGAKLENVDLEELPEDCEGSVELSEIRRTTNTNILHG